MSDPSHNNSPGGTEYSTNSMDPQTLALYLEQPPVGSTGSGAFGHTAAFSALDAFTTQPNPPQPGSEEIDSFELECLLNTLHEIQFAPAFAGPNHATGYSSFGPHYPAEGVIGQTPQPGVSYPPRQQPLSQGFIKHPAPTTSQAKLPYPSQGKLLS